jgi:hypothetical protein
VSERDRSDDNPLADYSPDWRDSPCSAIVRALQLHSGLRLQVARELGVAWRNEAPAERESRRYAVYLWRLERAVGVRCLELSSTPTERRLAQLYVTLEPICWILCLCLTWRAQPVSVARRDEPVKRVRDVGPHDFDTRGRDN